VRTQLRLSRDRAIRRRFERHQRITLSWESLNQRSDPSIRRAEEPTNGQTMEPNNRNLTRHARSAQISQNRIARSPRPPIIRLCRFPLRRVACHRATDAELLGMFRSLLVFLQRDNLRLLDENRRLATEAWVWRPLATKSPYGGEALQ
jgi:hypothetical protein